jgi:hypothetical protein
MHFRFQAEPNTVRKVAKSTKKGQTTLSWKKAKIPKKSKCRDFYEQRTQPVTQLWYAGSRLVIINFMNYNQGFLI